MLGICWCQLHVLRIISRLTNRIKTHVKRNESLLRIRYIQFVIFKWNHF
jgi:hypothetical protein